MHVPSRPPSSSGCAALPLPCSCGVAACWGRCAASCRWSEPWGAVSGDVGRDSVGVHALGVLASQLGTEHVALHINIFAVGAACGVCASA